MYFARTFRALSASALLAAPLLSGCTQDLASQESALVPICPQAPVEVVTFNDFSVPLGVGFNVVSDKPQLDPGHSWTVVNGKLLSDPAGFTIANYYNRLDTPAVDLAGKSNIRVRLKHRFQHTGIYQLFAFDSKGNRSLLRELGGANPQYPGYLIDEINVPASYASSGMGCWNGTAQINRICNDRVNGVRMFRGGSWYVTNAADLRAASRFFGMPAGHGSLLGFRCARD